MERDFRLLWELLPKVALCENGGVQGVHGLGIMAKASHWRDAAKLPLLQEVLCLMERVLLLR